MAQQGYAPKVFTRIDRAGRPTWSTLLVICCGGIAYISLLSGGSNVLSWLLAASTYSVTFSWASICVAHIRFRRAWKYHDHSLDEIPYKAPFGTYGSWFALFLIAFYFIAQVRSDTSLFPRALLSSSCIFTACISNSIPAGQPPYHQRDAAAHDQGNVLPHAGARPLHHHLPVDRRLRVEA